MKFLNRFTTYVLASVLTLTAAFSTPVYATDPAAASENRYNMAVQSNSWDNWPAGPQVYAESAIVMEASTGTILYAKNIDDQHYPASITKIMTVLLALEHLEMDEEVTFSHNAVYSIDYDSSHIARDEGEILTVEECLYAIMLESANECSNAIAEHIAGTTEAFAEMMNQKAAELGCTNTHFVNPHGLPDDNHYTSAHDMALITSAACQYEKFRQISSTPRYTLRATNKKDEELLMNNHHYMISNYKTSQFLDDTVFAGKTGYTSVALNTLVTCATRNGMDLVVVTMKTQGSGQRGVPIYTDTANLLNYASENFHKVNISENETNFTLGQSELFNTGSTIFGDSTPLIQMDTEGYVVLPVDVEFTAAVPQLEFVDEDNSDLIAVLSYTFAGQPVGSTELLLFKDDLQEFNFQKVDNEEAVSSDPAKEAAPESKEEPKLVKINLKITAIVAGIFLAIGLLAFLLFRISREYTLDLSFLRRWRKRYRGTDRNSFSNQGRKRYRSRKRRRQNRRY